MIVQRKEALIEVLSLCCSPGSLGHRLPHRLLLPERRHLPLLRVHRRARLQVRSSRAFQFGCDLSYVLFDADAATGSPGSAVSSRRRTSTCRSWKVRSTCRADAKCGDKPPPRDSCRRRVRSLRPRHPLQGGLRGVEAAAGRGDEQGAVRGVEGVSRVRARRAKPTQLGPWGAVQPVRGVSGSGRQVEQ